MEDQHHLPCDHPREDQHRTDRQIDSGGHDDEGFPNRQHDQVRLVGDDRADIEGLEKVRLDCAEGDHQSDLDQEDPQDVRRHQPAPPRPFGQGDLFDQLGRVPQPDRRPHATSSCVRAPVIAPTSCSSVALWAWNVATRTPSRSTSIRSATSRTSGMLWLMYTTEIPRSATRRITSWTCRRCNTPRAAVGSSRSTTLDAHTTDRATATAWRWPPDSD